MDTPAFLVDIAFGLAFLSLAVWLSAKTWSQIVDILHERAYWHWYQRAYADRAEALRRISQKAGDKGHEYERLSEELSTVNLELHVESLRIGFDPWDLYHPEIYRLMRSEEKGGKGVVTLLHPSGPNDAA